MISRRSLRFKIKHVFGVRLGRGPTETPIDPSPGVHHSDFGLRAELVELRPIPGLIFRKATSKVYLSHAQLRGPNGCGKPGIIPNYPPYVEVRLGFRARGPRVASTRRELPQFPEAGALPCISREKNPTKPPPHISKL
ncbi:hypothetical protein KQX54_003360 [Cotesia glomerata]|uniref:Uncharacterized protein n=1 Tax=Cotesia glomerata TaxID=32391 RepID=A0AAV7IJ84_COTGL|nr:hypothetical protein KQX54_003360 [Cotesia glomerata]